MRRRPSPSLVVSIIALVFAMAGTSIAAINYATNAGAVDGKSATGAKSSQARAAGKVVATSTGGTTPRGKIPNRFLDLSTVISGTKQSFAQGIEVTDNASSTAVALAGGTGVGLVSATCNDQDNKVGVEDPQVTITFSNTSGQIVNFSRSVGNGEHAVTTIAPNTTSSFNIGGQNTYHLYAQTGAIHYVMEGVVRQDAPKTAAGICAVYGYAVIL